MSPYRTAPVERPAQKAPRAPWWRRFTHRDVVRRMEIRRLRLVARAEAPFATWSACNDLAIAMHDSAHRHGLDGDVAAVMETIFRHQIATLRSRAPRPPPASGILPR